VFDLHLEAELVGATLHAILGYDLGPRWAVMAGPLFGVGSAQVTGDDSLGRCGTDSGSYTVLGGSVGGATRVGAAFRWEVSLMAELRWHTIPKCTGMITDSSDYVGYEDSGAGQLGASLGVGYWWW
jgi:hypothetical protein